MNYIQYCQIPAEPIRNWDNTLTGKLIIAAENPDSVGYSNGKWYAPTLKGYDPNQFGMGVDRNQTEGFSDKVKTDKDGVQYLTEEDERALRHQKIEEANNSANRRYEYAKSVITDRKHNNISPKKDAAVVSAIYNLGSGYIAKTLFEDEDFMRSLFDGTDEEVINRIHEEYKKKNRNERIANEKQFFKIKKEGGYLDYLKAGGEIHIKKSHEGRFTKFCNGKVTQECIDRGKKSKYAHIRKQAVFADNARHKFKH